MSDLQTKSMFNPFYFISEVTKEVIHQATGYKFEEDEKKSPQEIAEEAYGQAIQSAISQQEALDKELEMDSLWCNNESGDDLDSFFDMD